MQIQTLMVELHRTYSLDGYLHSTVIQGILDNVRRSRSNESIERVYYTFGRLSQENSVLPNVPSSYPAIPDPGEAAEESGKPMTPMELIHPLLQTLGSAAVPDKEDDATSPSSGSQTPSVPVAASPTASLPLPSPPPPSPAVPAPATTGSILKCHPADLQMGFSIDTFKDRTVMYLCDLCGHGIVTDGHIAWHMKHGAGRLGFRLVSVRPERDLKWYAVDTAGNEYVGDIRRVDGERKANTPIPAPCGPPIRKVNAERLQRLREKKEAEKAAAAALAAMDDA